MFEYLQSLGLPNFSFQNWTSEPRTHVRVLPGYENMIVVADGLADIEYFDESGTFADFLLAHGHSGQGVRSGARLTYYFEVKTTTNPNWQKSFHMSSYQQQHVSKL